MMGTYEYYENKSGEKYKRRCIDSSVVSCGECVGYCQFCEHPGFLTKSMRQQHDCLGKGCHHYVARPKAKKNESKCSSGISDIILKSVHGFLKDLEGIKALHVKDNGEFWTVDYVTVTNSYPMEQIGRAVSELVGKEVQMRKLQYDFDIAARIIFGI